MQWLKNGMRSQCEHRLCMAAYAWLIASKAAFFSLHARLSAATSASRVVRYFSKAASRAETCKHCDGIPPSSARKSAPSHIAPSSFVMLVFTASKPEVSASTCEIDSVTVRLLAVHSDALYTASAGANTTL